MSGAYDTRPIKAWLDGRAIPPATEPVVVLMIALTPLSIGLSILWALGMLGMAALIVVGTNR